MYSFWLLTEQPPFEKLCLGLNQVASLPKMSFCSVSHHQVLSHTSLQVLNLVHEPGSSDNPSFEWGVAAQAMCDNAPGTSPFQTLPRWHSSCAACVYS
jgi:hypothetical protein